MTETICGTFPNHAGNNNGTFTVRDDSITVNYASAPDIYEINVHYTDGTSQSFGTNYGTAPAPGSTEWAVALKSPAEWVQVHSFNDHYGEPSCPVRTPEPQPNPESRQTVTEGAPNCDDFTVPVTITTENAGYYLGNDGEWHLGDWIITSEETSARPATAEECPAPPVDEEEEPEPEEETPTTPEENTPNTNTETTNQPVKKSVETQTVQPVSNPRPEQLAATGAGLEWTALIIGAVFVAAGLALYLRRPKR